MTTCEGCVGDITLLTLKILLQKEPLISSMGNSFNSSTLNVKVFITELLIYMLFTVTIHTFAIHLSILPLNFHYTYFL